MPKRSAVILRSYVNPNFSNVLTYLTKLTGSESRQNAISIRCLIDQQWVSTFYTFVDFSILRRLKLAAKTDFP